MDTQGQAHEHCEGTDCSGELEFALHTHGRPIAHRGCILNRRLETWCSRQMHAPVSCSQAISHPDLAFEWKRALFQATCEEVDQASLLLAPPFLHCPNDCNKHNDRAAPGQVSLCRHAHTCMGCWLSAPPWPLQASPAWHASSPPACGRAVRLHVGQHRLATCAGVLRCVQGRSDTQPRTRLLPPSPACQPASTACCWTQPSPAQIPERFAPPCASLGAMALHGL